MAAYAAVAVIGGSQSALAQGVSLFPPLRCADADGFVYGSPWDYGPIVTASAGGHQTTVAVCGMDEVIDVLGAEPDEVVGDVVRAWGLSERETVMARLIEAFEDADREISVRSVEGGSCVCSEDMLRRAPRTRWH